MIRARMQELKDRARLAWRVLRGRDSSLVRHVQDEVAPDLSGSGPDAWMARHMIDMARVFSAEGHSGMSAAWAVGCLTKLLSYEPIRPLTGDADEWVVHGDGDELYAQNRRCGRVFRRRDGTAYDIDAVVFEEPDGGRFTSHQSRRDISFPYSPMTVIARVPFDATDEQKREAALLALGAQS